MLNTILTARPELALFAALAIGYGVGAIKLGPFKLGGVAGTLLAALAIGQFGIHVDADLQRFMFTLFVYALGFSVAPTFFASLDKTTWTWGLLVVIEVALILVVVFVATWLFKLDVGTASGLLAGAATESAMVGTASEAIGKLGLAAADMKAQQANVATAYALAYVFSLITIVLFASQAAPRLLGIDLRDEARKTLAKLGGVDANLDPDQDLAFPSLISRGFGVSAAAGKTVAAVELALGGNATVEAVRRHDADVKVTGDCLFETGDEVAVAGLRTALTEAARIIGPEVGDPSKVTFTVETRDVVLTRWPDHRAAVAAITEFLRASAIHGVYLAGITRDDRKLPALQDASVRRGDVLQLFGKPEDVARAAHLLGTAEIPGPATDFVYLGGGLIVGILTRHDHGPAGGRRLVAGQRGRAAVGSGVRLDAGAATHLRRLPCGGHSGPEGPRPGDVHRIDRAERRPKRRHTAGHARLGTADRGDLHLAGPDADLAVCRPPPAAHGSGDSLRRDLRTAGEHAGDQRHRGRRGQSRPGYWLHGDLRPRQHRAAPAGADLRRGLLRDLRASCRAIDGRRSLAAGSYLCFR